MKNVLVDIDNQDIQIFKALFLGCCHSRDFKISTFLVNISLNTSLSFVFMNPPFYQWPFISSLTSFFDVNNYITTTPHFLLIAVYRCLTFVSYFLLLPSSLSPSLSSISMGVASCFQNKPLLVLCLPGSPSFVFPHFLFACETAGSPSH